MIGFLLSISGLTIGILVSVKKFIQKDLCDVRMNPELYQAELSRCHNDCGSCDCEEGCSA